MRMGPEDVEVDHQVERQSADDAFKLDMQGNVIDINDSWEAVGRRGNPDDLDGEIETAQGDFTTTTGGHKQ